MIRLGLRLYFRNYLVPCLPAMVDCTPILTFLNLRSTPEAKRRELGLSRLSLILLTIHADTIATCLFCLIERLICEFQQLFQSLAVVCQGG